MTISDILPLIEQGKTTAQIAEHFNLSIPTINKYKKILRDHGYKLTIKNGRPFKQI